MKEIDLKILYRKWPIVRRFLKELGCSSQKAEDIFQEALLIFVRKKEEEQFELSVEPIHYIKNTCKFLWYNQARKEQKQATFSFEIEFEQMDETDTEKEQQLNLIEQAILKLGKQCQDILKLFYGKNKSMEEIAKHVGLRNEKVAKAQKYRCIQKVKDIFHQTNID